MVSGTGTTQSHPLLTQAVVCRWHCIEAGGAPVRRAVAIERVSCVPLKTPCQSIFRLQSFGQVLNLCHGYLHTCSFQFAFDQVNTNLYCKFWAGQHPLLLLGLLQRQRAALGDDLAAGRAIQARLPQAVLRQGHRLADALPGALQQACAGRDHPAPLMLHHLGATTQCVNTTCSMARELS